jgi:cell division protease FtsH
MAEGVDLAAVARRTSGFSGADLANVVNEAALLAARAGGQVIEQGQLLEAIERVVTGPERRSRLLTPAERLRIAFHEAGHAVVASALGHDRVAKLSIIARGHGGGFTWWELDGDQAFVTRSQVVARITAVLGGRAAEELVLGEQSSGATSDLEAAVRLARRMVTDHGMGEHLGPFSLRPMAEEVLSGAGALPLSERLVSQIDGEIQAILAAAAGSAIEVLRAHRGVLDGVANALLEAESLDGPALERLLAPLAAQTPGGPGGPSTPAAPQSTVTAAGPAADLGAIRE